MVSTDLIDFVTAVFLEIRSDQHPLTEPHGCLLYLEISLNVAE